MSGTRVLGAAEAQRLSAAVKRMLRSQCDDDWDRVTVDDDGAYVVWNNAAQAARTCAPVEPLKPTPTRRESLPEAKALNALIGTKADAPRSGVQVVSAHRDEPEDRFKYSVDPHHMNWDNVDLEVSAVRLRDQLIHGLPETIPFKYLPDVLALSGVDFDAVDAAIRHPQRVEIRPETAEKKYPVLAFHRGDVNAILGMRDPVCPAVMAVYVTSRLDGNGIQVQMLTGGGGTRKRQGLPGSAHAMVKAIRSMGGMIDTTDPAAKTAEVTYKGQSLGKVTVGSCPRATVHSDYQRVVRKVHAIDQRETVSA